MNTRLTAAVALLTATLVFAGCAGMQGRGSQASPNDANNLAAAKSIAGNSVAPAAWPRTDWWKQLHDPQLDRLIDEALADSPTLRVAEARVRQALAFATTTHSALLPQVNGDAELTRERFPEHGLIPPPFNGTWATQAQLEATANYEFDLWGKNRAAYESAVGQAKAAEIDAFATRLMLSDERYPVNLGSPEELTILEFAQSIRRLTGESVPIEYHPLPEDDPKRRRPDITKARRILGWEPRVPLDEGLRQTLEYFQARAKTAV